MPYIYNPFINNLDNTGSGGGGSGDVTGPASSTDNALVRFDGTSGIVIQNGVVVEDDSGNLSLVASVTTSNGGALRTGTSAANTTLLQAYDVDGASYTTFATLTANNTPTFAISGATLDNSVVGGTTPAAGSFTSVTLSNTGALRTATSAGNTALLAAYDVDGASYTTFGTLTANNTPTFDLSDATTKGGGYIYRAGGTAIALADGGTNASLTASNGGIFYSTATAGAILSGTATANQVLLSGSSTTPAWSTATYPATTTINQLLYSSSANVIAGLATGNSGTLITSAGGVPSISSTLPSAVQGNITTVGTIGTGVWQGSKITEGFGGTNQSTYTTGDILYASGSNTLSKLAISTTPGAPIASSGTVPLYRDPAQYIFLADDMFGVTGNSGWSNPTANAGTGAQTTTSANPGQFICGTGVNTNGASALRFEASDTCFIFSGGRMVLNLWAQLSALSDNTDTYIATIGFSDNATGATGVDGAYFTYTNGTNSGNWQIVTANNSTRTTSNTSTAADTNWNKFTIDCNAAGTSVAFYINNVQVTNSPIATNIPTGAGRSFTIGLNIVKSAGTTARTFTLDLMTFYQALTVSR